MGMAALVVAIVAALAAVSAVWYARRSDRSAAAAATAAATTAALDMQRRNAELTPQFRITCEPANPGSPTLRLGVFLSGPPDLERLDALTVTIRDDHPWRGQGTPLAGGSDARAGRRADPGTVPVHPRYGTRRRPGPRRPGRRPDRTHHANQPGCPSARSCRSSSSRHTRHPGRSSRTTTGCASVGGATAPAGMRSRQGWDPWVLTCEVDPEGQSKVEIP